MDHLSTGASTNGRHDLDPPPDAEFDALADLYLGPATNGHAVRDRSPSTPPALEAVVLGHLPVSASAWPGQYARRRAETLGEPVAIVRLSNSSIALDLIGTGKPDRPIASERDAIRYAASVAGAVILRVDEPDEPMLAAIPELESLCLLTGADDAAVVACYRKLKALAASTDDGLLPPTHLTIMGATAERAELAHERVARAAAAFLEADLLEPVVIDRVGPTGSTALFQGPTELTIPELTDLLTETPDREETAASPVLDTIGLGNTSSELLQPEILSLPPDPSPTTPSLRTGAEEQPPAPVAEPGEDTICALIRGLTPLAARCPTASRITLAADQEGRLHLVGALLSKHPGLSSGDAIGDLLRAGAWARTNAALLTQAEPSLSHADPVMHLVTDQAALATPLLGTTIRVHIAAEATPLAFGLTAVPLS